MCYKWQLNRIWDTRTSKMELTKDFCSIINPTFPEGIEFLAAFPVASSKNFSNLFSGGTGGSGGGIGFGSDESP